MDRDAPNDTDIVLLSIGINNVAIHGSSREAAQARADQIASTLSARGIDVIRLGTEKQFQGSISEIPKLHVEGEPGKTGPSPGTTSWHLTSQGYAIVV